MEISELFFLLLKVSATIATFFSLLELGLQLEIKETLVGLRDLRFLILTLLWAFVLGPALAYILTLVLPLTAPYANGLMVMSMVPGAAYLAMLVERAGGDVRYSASFLLLTSFGIVLFVPLFLPYLVTGVSVTSWDIAKPMLILVMAPLLIGIMTRKSSLDFATRWRPFVKKLASIGLLGALLMTIACYGKGIIISVGSFALGSLILFYILLTVATWLSASGMKPEHKSVLSLGVLSRNSGPAVAIAISIPDLDGQAFVMIGLGILVQVALSFPLASKLGKKTK